MTIRGTKTVRLALAASALAFVMGMGPALAGCYEDGVNCTNDHYIPKSVLRGLSCDSLWTLRNSIYNEHGYCFVTKAAKKVFDNDDCTVHNSANLGFNSFEQGNIDRIASVEKEFSCPK